MLPPLPSPVSECEVPEYFAPSSWERLEVCAFSVWARDQGSLPASPEAIIGTILHTARQEILERGLVGDARSGDVQALLLTLVTAEEERLSRSDAYADVIPLARVVGARRWLELTGALRLWARNASADFSVARRRPRAGVRAEGGPTAPAGIDRDDAFAYGIERVWRSSAYRLKGRPDEARLAADGVVEVVDYKSGESLDSEGNPLPAVETQLQLYLLMAELLTNRRARGFVQGRDVTKVAWGPEERADLEKRIAALTSRFPAGRVVGNEVAANAGRHCIGCSLRPTCSVYLRDVSQWWDNSGRHERPLPYDTWGLIVGCKRDALGWNVMLNDPSGRTVLLRGLTDRHGVEDLPVGGTLFAFGLEPTEDVHVHGRRLHPRSFHERSPGPRWPDAYQVRIYRG